MMTTLSDQLRHQPSLWWVWSWQPTSPLSLRRQLYQPELRWWLLPPPFRFSHWLILLFHNRVRFANVDVFVDDRLDHVACLVVSPCYRRTARNTSVLRWCGLDHSSHRSLIWTPCDDILPLWRCYDRLLSYTQRTSAVAVRSPCRSCRSGIWHLGFVWCWLRERVGCPYLPHPSHRWLHYLPFDCCRRWISYFHCSVHHRHRQQSDIFAFL